MVKDDQYYMGLAIKEALRGSYNTLPNPRVGAVVVANGKVVSKGYHRSESFDHDLLEQVPNEVNKMIAGNIQIDDIPKFKNKDFIIDLSGSIESNEGKKDINKIDKLLKLFAKT